VIPDPYSIGWALVRLARLQPPGGHPDRYWRDARRAWASIDRQDLINSVQAEFAGTEGTGEVPGASS
jgi:hypothetical protein